MAQAQYIRRSRNYGEDYSDELQKSHLFLSEETKSNGRRTFVLKWIILDVHSLLNGIVYAGHHIRFEKTIHRLRISRRFQKQAHFLVGLTPFWGKRTNVSFCLSDGDVDIHPENCVSTFGNVPNRKCYSEFLTEASKTFHCKVIIECDASAGSIDIDKCNDLVSDLERLLTTADFSDVTVEVDGQDLRVHRAVLSSRSPVFRAMFRNGMTENTTGRLVIKDSDSGSFQEFLKYLYTGRTRPLDPETAVRLLVLADKYAVRDLREEVVGFLELNMEVDHVVRVFLAADAHNEKDLKSEAALFIAEHLTEVMQSHDWALLKDRADLMEEVLWNFT